MNNTNKDLEKKFINVAVESGMVQEISGIPQGYTVIIKDYDTERVSSDQIEKDDHGRDCSINFYESPLDAAGVPDTTSRQLLLDTLVEAAYWRYVACQASKIRKSKPGALDDVICNTHVLLSDVELQAVLEKLNETLG